MFDFFVIFRYLIYREKFVNILQRKAVKQRENIIDIISIINR